MCNCFSGGHLLSAFAHEVNAKPCRTFAMTGMMGASVPICETSSSSCSVTGSAEKKKTQTSTRGSCTDDKGTLRCMSCSTSAFRLQCLQPCLPTGCSQAAKTCHNSHHCVPGQTQAILHESAADHICGGALKAASRSHLIKLKVVAILPAYVGGEIACGALTRESRGVLHCRVDRVCQLSPAV